MRKCWRLCTRSDEEIRTYITAMAASGMASCFPISFRTCARSSFELISKLFPMTQGRRARSTSWIPSSRSSSISRMRASARTVAFINWEIHRVTSLRGLRRIPRPRIWSGRNVGVLRRKVYIPRSAPLREGVCVHPITSSAIVGSDASLVMQSEWSADGDAVKGKRIKSGERLLRHQKAKIRPHPGAKFRQLQKTADTYFMRSSPTGRVHRRF